MVPLDLLTQGQVSLRDIEDQGISRTSQQPNQVLDGDLVTTVIDFNIVTIQIQMAFFAGINTASELVPRIARDVVCEH
jgi:hypothetical protein